MSRAREFAGLHADLLVLRNAWDAVSARLVEAEGAVAVATTSAAVAWAAGYTDGERAPFEEHVRVVRAIARVVRLPISVDIERGYSSSPAEVAENCARLVEAGACGVNLEDAAEAPELLAAKISAVKARLGADIFINARTDLLMHGPATAEELIRRAKIYEAAGAESFFVMRLMDESVIREVTRGTALPLNIMATAQLPSPPLLREWGVRRVSAGPMPALSAYAALLGRPITYPEANILMSSRSDTR